MGTYLAHKFQAYLHRSYNYEEGSSAKGIDCPELGVDMKVTSIRQHSRNRLVLPIRTTESVRSRIFTADLRLPQDRQQRECNGRLDIRHVIFVEAGPTADFQLTSGLIDILQNEGNKEDLIAFMNDRMLPGDGIVLSNLADELLNNRPTIGYFTISNALQSRLQYGRVIEQADSIQGIIRIA